MGRSAPPVARSGGGETLRGLVVLYRRLSALAAAPDGPGAVTRLLTEELRVVAAVVAPDSTVLAASAPGVDEARAAAVLRAEIAEPRWGRVLAAAARGGRALRVPGRAPGCAWWSRWRSRARSPGSWWPRRTRARTSAAAGDDVVLLAAEHAATIVGVLLGRERVLAVAAGQVRDDLISGLVLGRARSSAEAAQWAEHVGLDADRPHRVLVVVPAAPAEQEAAAPAELLATVRDRIARLVPDVLAVVRDREVVAVIPAGADPEGVGTRVAHRAGAGAREPWPVTVALGREAADVAGLPRSYDQAHRTVEAARRLGREGRLLRFEDLGVHRLLLQVPDPEDARVFAREVLGRLATDPSERTVELIRTLARYFREDGSPQRTAKVLSVHPNTVGYRLRRAEELSGLVARLLPRPARRAGRPGDPRVDGVSERSGRPSGGGRCSATARWARSPRPPAARADGAGSELVLLAPELVSALHRRYTDAGAQVIQTHTYGAGRLRLARHGLTRQVREINLTAARLARAVADDAGRRVFVAGSISPATSPARPGPGRPGRGAGGDPGAGRGPGRGRRRPARARDLRPRRGARRRGRRRARGHRPADRRAGDVRLRGRRAGDHPRREPGGGGRGGGRAGPGRARVQLHARARRACSRWCGGWRPRCRPGSR